MLNTSEEKDKRSEKFTLRKIITIHNSGRHSNTIATHIHIYLYICVFKNSKKFYEEISCEKYLKRKKKLFSIQRKEKFM